MRYLRLKNANTIYVRIRLFAVFFREANKYLKMLVFIGSTAQRECLSKTIFDGYIDILKNTVRVASFLCILENVINLCRLIYFKNFSSTFFSNF